MIRASVAAVIGGLVLVAICAVLTIMSWSGVAFDGRQEHETTYFGGLGLLGIVVAGIGVRGLSVATKTKASVSTNEVAR